MALILSLETSTAVCSIALHQQGQLMAYEALCRAQTHAESLLPMIQHLLQIARFEVKDLDAVAISEGPGSYTGLRIGAATAMGLAYALDKPLVAVNTLEAMVARLSMLHAFPALYCPMIDARRMEVYCLVADGMGRIYSPIAAHIIIASSFANFLQNSPVIFFGDGMAKCKPILGGKKNAFFIEGLYPSAEQVGVLAYKKFQEKHFANLANFEPLYLKSPL
jgi:tRNA threonylcarbamoyladenosine biosynthesis protein TsaB